MTEPVESWIRRAADRCAALGLSNLAEALTRHARAEAGHHLMMIADLRSLAGHWNSRHTPPVDADELLRMPPSYGASRYCLVHEENIAGNTPYAQIAIEYEIEQLPLRYGGLFVARCLEIFGPEILPSLSFVTEHIETLHEINIEAREQAQHLGVTQFEMMPALEDSPTFISALADVVLRSLARKE